LFRTNARLVLIMLRGKARHFSAMRLGRCVFEVDQNGRPTTRVELPSGKSRGCVLPIRAFLAGRSFDPKAINAMSLAFGDACDALGLHPTVKDPATSLVAEKVIELAIGGVHDTNALRTMTLEEFSQNDLPARSRATSRREAKRCQNQRAVREPDRNGPAYQTFLPTCAASEYPKTGKILEPARRCRGVVGD
jgi:hypothetical protein